MRMENEQHACFLDSCDLEAANGLNEYSWLMGFGSIANFDSKDASSALSGLQNFHNNKKDWLFGVLSYDIKSSVHPSLKSHNTDGHKQPLISFFQPSTLAYEKDGVVYLESQENAQIILDGILSLDHQRKSNELAIKEITASVSRDHYLKTIHRIKEEISLGNVYEVNYCVNNQTHVEPDFSPTALFRQLCRVSPAPFAAFFKYDHHCLMSSSPERYLKKEGSKLISQPIKGTRPRGTNAEDDLQQKLELQNSLKERAENVMIVDLVRNDLAHTCLPATVHARELFGIYSYKQVHQMVSTIEGTMEEQLEWVEAIRQSFPMGSMTGAPKIAAMQLIEDIEDFKRGWYSGSVGYVDPDGNFDFNVIIRSLLLNRETGILSFATGGAITYDSSAEEEWRECELKASGIRTVLNS